MSETHQLMAMMLAIVAGAGYYLWRILAFLEADKPRLVRPDVRFVEGRTVDEILHNLEE